MKCNLKELMAKAGIKRYELAQALGYKPMAITNWITGRSFPTGSRLDDICGLLNCTLDELFTIEPTEWEWEEIA